MFGIGRDRFVGKFDEIDYVRGNDRTPFSRRVGELAAVVELDVASVKRGNRVDALLPKKFGNCRREIFIEIDLHRAKRISPGYRFSIASAVSAVLASIFD